MYAIRSYYGHTLIAVWDEKGTLQVEKVDLSGAYKTKGITQQKGIALLEKPSNFATYSLEINK